MARRKDARLVLTPLPTIGCSYVDDTGEFWGTVQGPEEPCRACGTATHYGYQSTYRTGYQRVCLGCVRIRAWTAPATVAVIRADPLANLGLMDGHLERPAREFLGPDDLAAHPYRVGFNVGTALRARGEAILAPDELAAHLRREAWLSAHLPGWDAVGRKGSKAVAARRRYHQARTGLLAAVRAALVATCPPGSASRMQEALAQPFESMTLADADLIEWAAALGVAGARPLATWQPPAPKAARARKAS